MCVTTLSTVYTNNYILMTCYIYTVRYYGLYIYTVCMCICQATVVPECGGLPGAGGVVGVDFSDRNACGSHLAATPGLVRGHTNSPPLWPTHGVHTHQG